jgi:hypothetical protein
MLSFADKIAALERELQLIQSSRATFESFVRARLLYGMGRGNALLKWFFGAIDPSGRAFAISMFSIEKSSYCACANEGTTRHSSRACQFHRY